MSQTSSSSQEQQQQPAVGRAQVNSTSSDLFDEVLASQSQPSEAASQSQPNEAASQEGKIDAKRWLSGRLSASPSGKGGSNLSPQRKLVGKVGVKRDFGRYFGKQRATWQYTFTHSPGTKQNTPAKVALSHPTPPGTTESGAGAAKRKRKKKNVNTGVFDFQSDDEDGINEGENDEFEEVILPSTKKARVESKQGTVGLTKRGRKGLKAAMASATPGKRGRKPAAKLQGQAGSTDFPVVKRGRGRPRKYPILGAPGQAAHVQLSSPSRGKQWYKQQQRRLQLQQKQLWKQQQLKRKWQRLQKQQRGQESSPDVPVVKRGRGRPRKYPRPGDFVAMRSPAGSVGVSPSVVQKSPGTPGVKRGRGRPRKYPRPEDARQVGGMTMYSPADGVSTSPSVTQYSPATPQQGKASAGGTPVAKRGRGRPRKYPKVEATNQVGGVTMYSPADGVSGSPSVSQDSASTPQQGKEGTGGSPVVKRGRGRPRKYPKVEAPGRIAHVATYSPADSTGASPSVSQDSPATPQLSSGETSGSPVVKRGRGRPRKYPKVGTPGQVADVTMSSPTDVGSVGVSPSVSQDSPATPQQNVDGTSGSPVAKRGRGRPRKHPRVEVPGRVGDAKLHSPVVSVGMSPSLSEGSPGTPLQNKEDGGGTPVVKRGRGRPRKYPKVVSSSQVTTSPSLTSVTSVSPSASESSPAIQQPKPEGTVGTPPVVKRGRGRPRKYPRVEDPSKIVDSSPSSSDETATEATPTTIEQRAEANMVKSPLIYSMKAPTCLASESKEVPVATQALPKEHTTTMQEQDAVNDTSSAKSGMPDVDGEMPSTDKAGESRVLAGKKRTASDAGLSQQGDKEGVETLAVSEAGKAPEEGGGTEEDGDVKEVGVSQAETEEEDPLPKKFKDKQEQPPVVDLCDIAGRAKSSVAVGGESGKGEENLAASAEERNRERSADAANETAKAHENYAEETEASKRSVIVGHSKDVKPAAKEEEEEVVDNKERMKEADKEHADKVSGVTRDQPTTGDAQELSKPVSFPGEEPSMMETGEEEGEGEKKSDGGATVTEPRRVESPPPKPASPDEVFDVAAKEDGTSKPDQARARSASMEAVTKHAESEAGTSHKRRNSDKDVKAGPVPSLTKSATWPKPSLFQSSVSSLASHKQNAVMVRNVRQAHECLEHGENLRFQDEVEYLLDSMRLSQPLSVRCLSTLNLASQCLKNDFYQQLRARGLMNKIFMLLKDALDYPTLSVSTATLFYILTRDKVDCAELDRRCVELLVGLLAKDERERLEQEERADEEEDESSGPTKESLTEVMVNGKEARELERIKKKAKSVLSNCPLIPVKEKDRKQGEAEGGDDDEEEAGEDQEEVLEEGKGGDEDCVGIRPSDLSLGELSCEALLSLTSSSGSSCNWLREEMRILGALDHVANKVISLMTSVRPQLQDGGSLQSPDIEAGETRTRLQKIQRLLRLIENATFLSKANQTYVTVFDGNLLVSELCSTAKLLQSFLTTQEPAGQQQLQTDPLLRLLVLEVLLMVFRVLLNLTHDNELGSHRVGEQTEVLQLFLGSAFKLPKCVADDKRFDVLVLSLGLLINLMEHSAPNREHLFRIPSGAVSPTGSALKDVIELFLSHHTRAEQATIDVPTPQRLSQLTPQSSPLKSPQAKKDLATRIKGHKLTKGYRKQGAEGSHEDAMEDEAEEGMEDKASGEGEEEDTEEEEPACDPLVFSREEFDAALTQAGKHMEDSIIASYAALLLGVLAKHNNEFAKQMTEYLPEKNFSSLISVLKKFVSFMNITGSSSTRSGLDSVKKIIKHLETS